MSTHTAHPRLPPPPWDQHMGQRLLTSGHIRQKAAEWWSADWWWEPGSFRGLLHGADWTCARARVVSAQRNEHSPDFYSSASGPHLTGDGSSYCLFLTSGAVLFLMASGLLRDLNEKYVNKLIFYLKFSGNKFLLLIFSEFAPKTLLRSNML